MTSTIREWARGEGIEVAERGIIPRDVVERYKQAHGIGAHVEPEPFELLEPRPIFETQPMPLEAWLERRDELTEIINSTVQSERAAEKILLAGWTRPS